MVFGRESFETQKYQCIKGSKWITKNFLLISDNLCLIIIPKENRKVCKAASSDHFKTVLAPSPKLLNYTTPTEINRNCCCQALL